MIAFTTSRTDCNYYPRNAIRRYCNFIYSYLLIASSSSSSTLWSATTTASSSKTVSAFAPFIISNNLQLHTNRISLVTTTTLRRRPNHILLHQHYPEQEESHSDHDINFMIPSSSSIDTKSKKLKKIRFKKTRQRKTTTSSSTSEQQGLPISDDDDVAAHVSSTYLHGNGGVIRNIQNKRSRFESSSRMFTADSAHKEQLDYLKMLDRHPALVLNADYQPLSILPLSLWSWQETIKCLFSGKVRVVDIYPGLFIRAVNVNVPLPSVIALTDYVPQPNQTPAFTRRNVFLRDGYRCQYCSMRFRTEELTLDHVTPRSHGGKLEWKNTATSCKRCNGKKGSILPKDLKRVGMRLLRPPSIPTKWELAHEASKMVPRNVHPTWRPFLGLALSPSSNGVETSENNMTSLEAHD